MPGIDMVFGRGTILGVQSNERGGNLAKERVLLHIVALACIMIQVFNMKLVEELVRSSPVPTAKSLNAAINARCHLLMRSYLLFFSTFPCSSWTSDVMESAWVATSSIPPD